MHNCNAQFYCLDGDPGSVQTSKILFFAKVKIWKPPSIAYYLKDSNLDFTGTLTLNVPIPDKKKILTEIFISIQLSEMHRTEGLNTSIIIR